MPERERILLVRLSHLGDVVHALPVFHSLRRAHPDAEIAWAIEPAFSELLEGLPGLARRIPFERHAGARAWPRLARAIGEFRPQRVVDAQGNLKSAAVSLCARGARRLGMAREDWREPLGAYALHASASPARAEGGAELHAVDRMVQLARFVGAADAIADFDLGLREDELARGEGALSAALGSTPRPGDVILALGAADDVRSWPITACERLAVALAAQDRRVLVLSGPAEQERGRELAAKLQATRGVRHWVGQRGLRELAAAFRAAARANARFIGQDSGPMHLAAACGLSVIALEGPQSHHRTGPWPVPERDGAKPRHRALRSLRSPACAPCFSRRCSHRDGPVCLSELAPEQVVAALTDDD